MKMMKVILEAIFWPIKILFSGENRKVPFYSRLRFSATGIIDIILLVYTVAQVANPHSDSIRINIFWAIEAIVLAAFYLSIYGFYFFPERKRKDVSGGNIKKPMSRLAIWWDDVVKTKLVRLWWRVSDRSRKLLCEDRAREDLVSRYHISYQQAGKILECQLTEMARRVHNRINMA